MLDSKGFDLWADGYDESVRISEASDRYPFAGYKKVLGTIYEKIRQQLGKKDFRCWFWYRGIINETV